MEYNKFQTRLTEDYLESLSNEVKRDLFDYIDNIIFIQRLIDPKILSVKDLKKDDEGKAIVDITRPHYLENMDYFRPSAKFYEENGCYTKLRPNKHPNSPYMKFWKQEAERIRNGMVREDGEWIPGSLYWYWNYCPIIKTVQREGKKRGDRIEGFPNPWLGTYLFYHYLEQAREAGEHGEILKRRGIGYSYMISSFGPRSALFFKKARTFYTAFEKEYLIKDGVLNKVWDRLGFLAEHTPFPRARTRDAMMEKRIGYVDTRYNVEKGMQSDIIGISAKDDPDKIRGKRGDIIVEEHGVFPGLKKLWNVARKSVEDGDVAFALMLAGGTGGTENADFEAAEDMHYHPNSYKIHGVPNVFDKGADGSQLTGFFWGSYLNREGCYDKDGNPDVIKAVIQTVTNINKIKQGASNPNIVTQAKAEDCTTPQEAVLRTTGSIFPTADIKDYLSDISVKIEKFVDSHYVGRLGYDDNNNLVLKQDPNSSPIREYPLNDRKDLGGAIEIFAPPHEKTKSLKIGERYIAGVDPFNADTEDPSSSSLGSIFIFDLFEDAIVAEYTGRPARAQEFHEICYRLAKYYNAEINNENEDGGALYGYFKMKDASHYLADTPSFLRTTDYIKGTPIGNKSKGTPGNSKKINSLGRSLQADWMLEVDDKDVQKLRKIRSIGYLKEASSWNPDGNFDRISAVNMVMILRYEKLQYADKVKMEIEDDPEVDDFWSKNFSNKFGFTKTLGVGENKVTIYNDRAMNNLSKRLKEEYNLIQ